MLKKGTFFKKFLVLFILFSPFIERAKCEKNAPEATSPLDPSHFSYSLKVQARYAFYDSSQKNSFDLIGEMARFGLNYRFRNIGSVIEVQAGNPTTTAVVTSSQSSSSTTTNQNAFIVGKANVFFNFAQLDETSISLVIGRDRLNTSIMYSPDGLTLVGTNVENASSAAFHSGLSLKYIGDHDSYFLYFGAGYYENAVIAIQAAAPIVLPYSVATIGQGDNTYGTPLSTQSRALSAWIGTNIYAGDGMFELRNLYQTQPKAVTSVDSSKTISTGKYQARDASSIETSIGYNYRRETLRTGFWFQFVNLGQTQISIGGTSNNLSYTNLSQDSDLQTILTLGYGLTGTSKLFGISNLLTRNDSITMGFAFQFVTGGLYSSAANSEPVFQDAKTKFLQLNYGLGYQEAFYKLELNALYTKADHSVYNGKSGNQNVMLHTTVYLSGVISL